MKTISLFLLFILASCQVKQAQETGVVEGHVPSAYKFTVTTPLNTSYAPASVIPFTLTFPKVVTVTGTPQLTITIGATNRTVNYVSGSGSAVLLFNYTVQAGENDTNGIALSTTLDLNGGTLIYETDKNCSTTLTIPTLTTVLVDSTGPTITLVTPPSNGTYIGGGVLNFSFKFSENVTVTGTPRLPIILNSGTIYANYFSGSGTDTLVFSYTVLTSDIDADGISMQPLELNGGTIKDSVLNDANLTYTPPDTSSIIVAGDTPVINSITPPANGRYLTGQNVDFTVNFDQAVFVSLTPRIAITAQNGTVYANYVSGGGTSALLFRYTVAAGDYDTDGIVLVSPLEPNGGAIQNISMTINAQLSFTPPDTSSITVDGLDPVISTVTPPANAWYVSANNLDFTVNYTYPVVVTGTPKLSMTVGGSSVEASYLSGSGTTALIFRYTVAAGNLDTDGIATSSPVSLNGGTLKDIFGDNAGLTFTPPDTTGVLVDAIVPTITSVSPPASATYYNNNLVEFSVLFSESVIVNVSGGTPQISLTVGAASKAASYVSGSGSSTLVFRYTVGSGDFDADGIANSSPLVLNSGTIKDAAGNDLSPLTFTPPSTAGVIVDATIASISSITPPANATYETSNTLDFIVNFTRPVSKTGSPRLQLDVGGVTLYADYLSGSGTAALTFRYTVLDSHKDLNGLALTSPLDLNGGTIVDSTPNNATLTFTAPDTSGILIDGVDLIITSVTPPADATYLYNQNMDFTVNYNDVAVVTGSPRIQLTVGAATLYATYLSGSGSAALIFRFTVGSTDIDSDGVTTVGPNLDLNGGTIKDEFNDSASLAFTATNYPDKKVEGTVPYIASVAGPAAATYTETQNLDFIVTYSEAVNVSGTRIALTIGTNTRYAAYISGTGTTTVTYRYTISTADNDSDGIISSSPLDLNGGTVADLAGNALNPLTFSPPDTSAVLVDGTAPNITSVTAPANATYAAGNNIDFTVNYSVPVDVVGGPPRIAINVGGTTAYANYNSGSGTSVLIFRYTVAAGHADTDGIALTSPIELNGGTMKGASLVDASRTFTAPDTTGILVDGIDIVISSITPPADATYKIGDNLDFTVNYNYAATVTGTPRIQLTVGAATLYASYVSGSGTSGHQFRYTVAVNDVDTDGITTVSPIDLNSGTIKDIFGDNATLTFSGANYPNKKVDGIRPTISSMAASGNATYKMGQTIDFTATYSEAVSVSGTRLTLTVGATTRYADYYSGSGTSSIVFRYTVLAGDLDTDGIAVASSVDLNGGTITDVPGNAQTTLTFTPPTLTGVLVDGVVPTISSITPPSSQTYGNSADLNFTVNFSESVTITGTPTLSLNIGGSSVSATYVSGSPSTAIVFRYTTVTNDSDTDGVASVSPLALAGGTIQDQALNDADLTFGGSTHAGVLVDAVAPSISSVTPPSDNSYKPAANLDFTVVFNENVTVVTTGGTPSINVTIGANTRLANYLSGSGTTSLIFRYALVAGDDDYDGLSANSTLQLNGGTIRDAVLNNASTSLGAIPLDSVFTIPTEMAYWYDLTSTTTVGSSTTTLLQFSSKAGTALNGTITGTPAYANTGFNSGSSGFTTLSGTDYVSLSNLTVKYVIAVYKTPTAASKTLLYDSTGGGAKAQLTFGTSGLSGLVLGSPCALTCKSYNGTLWTPADASGNLSYTWSSGQYRVVIIDYAGETNFGMRIGYNSFDGELAELIIFTGTASITDARMNLLKDYLNAKHGVTY